MRILIIHNRYKSNNIGGEDVVFDNEMILLKEKLGKSNVFSYEVSNDNINIAVEKTIRIVDGKANETGKKKIIIIKPNSIEEGIFFI